MNEYELEHEHELQLFSSMSASPSGVSLRNFVVDDEMFMYGKNFLHHYQKSIAIG